MANLRLRADEARDLRGDLARAIRLEVAVAPLEAMVPVRGDRILELLVTVTDVDDVGIALAADLPKADVDHRSAERGRFANAGAGVADHAAGMGHRVHEVLQWHVAHHVELVVILVARDAA